MPTVYRYSLCVVLMSCLLASGCRTAKELGKSLGDLEKVRAELIKKFGEEGVNLHINTGPRSSTISVLRKLAFEPKVDGRTCQAGPGNRRNRQAALFFY